ncbi:MAG: hypothetical protein RMI93_05525 [Caldimicrobium sp.]|nr:hypothetical protein [Caldimicrobium sp.]MDW8183046.1 hypothetical protein [Caldimicrobium sp.]
MKKTSSIKIYSFALFVTLFLIGTILTLKHSYETSAEDFKCLKCHKGKDSLEKYVQEKKIKSAEELRSLVRKGPKAGLHLTSTEEDIEKAVKYLKLP